MRVIACLRRLKSYASGSPSPVLFYLLVVTAVLIWGRLNSRLQPDLIVVRRV